MSGAGSGAGVERCSTPPPAKAPSQQSMIRKILKGEAKPPAKVFKPPPAAESDEEEEEVEVSEEMERKLEELGLGFLPGEKKVFNKKRKKPEPESEPASGAEGKKPVKKKSKPQPDANGPPVTMSISYQKNRQSNVFVRIFDEGVTHEELKELWQQPGVHRFKGGGLLAVIMSDELSAAIAQGKDLGELAMPCYWLARVRPSKERKGVAHAEYPAWVKEWFVFKDGEFVATPDWETGPISLKCIRGIVVCTIAEEYFTHITDCIRWTHESLIGALVGVWS